MIPRHAVWRPLGAVFWSAGVVGDTLSSYHCHPMNPFLRVIDALNGHQVRYVVVGGFASYLHGTRRVTVDLDIVVDLQEAEARKAIEALLSIGLKSRVPVDPYSFADPSERQRWSHEKNMIVFSMFDPAVPGFVVDLMIDLPADFVGLSERSKEVELHGRKVRISGIDDLIAMKLRAGRPQDLLDVDTLRCIQSMNQDDQGQ